MAPPGRSRIRPRLPRTSREWSTRGAFIPCAMSRDLVGLLVLQDREEDARDGALHLVDVDVDVEVQTVAHPRCGLGAAATAEGGAEPVGEHRVGDPRDRRVRGLVRPTVVRHAHMVALWRDSVNGASPPRVGFTSGQPWSTLDSVDQRRPTCMVAGSPARRPHVGCAASPGDVPPASPGRRALMSGAARPASRSARPASRSGHSGSNSLRWTREGSRDRFRCPRARHRQGPRRRPGGRCGDRGPGQPGDGRDRALRGASRWRPRR